jgi:hypothetical protein
MLSEGVPTRILGIKDDGVAFGSTSNINSNRDQI